MILKIKIYFFFNCSKDGSEKKKNTFDSISTNISENRKMNNGKCC